MGAQAILVGTVYLANEGGGDVPLPRAHEEGLGSDRDGRRTAVLEAQESDALSVDREVDVLESGAVAEERLDREDVLPVGGEVVHHHDSAARSKGGAIQVIPGVLRDLDRARVLDARRTGLRVADREAA